LAQRAEPVEHRHLQIEQQHVRIQLADQLDGPRAVARLAHHCDVVLQVEERAQPLTHHRMVVGDQHPDHTPTSTRTVVPSPGAEVRVSRPPTDSARSFIDASPSPREGPCSNPVPSSATSSTSLPSAYDNRTATSSAPA